MPAALVAYVLGFWRLAADMGVAGEFAIQGLFSHWQVWLMLAAGLTIASSLLNRYGRGDQVRVPKILQFRPRPESPEPIVNKARVQ